MRLPFGSMPRFRLQVFPLYGEDATRGDHPDLR
jgi:hypothetical protein